MLCECGSSFYDYSFNIRILYCYCIGGFYCEDFYDGILFYTVSSMLERSVYLFVWSPKYCVTQGMFNESLYADARKQVQEATVWMGGEYSPDLHSQCTHLVVQISFIKISIHYK